MRHLPALALGLLVPVFALAVACGDDDSETSTFDLTVVIEGSAGTVSSLPAGVQCEGPKDCGVTSFAPGTVTLRATAGPAQRLARWTVDGVDRPIDPAALDVVGAAGAKIRVVATFADNGGGSGNGSGSGSDAGSDAGDGGTSAVACDAASDCTRVGDVCCVETVSNGSTYTVSSITCQSAASCASPSTSPKGIYCRVTDSPDPVCPTGSGCFVLGDDNRGFCRAAP